AFRKAHSDRLRQQYGLQVNGHHVALQAGSTASVGRVLERSRLNSQGQVHLLLSAFPLPRIEQVYPTVFEKILGERISTSPVLDGCLRDLSGPSRNDSPNRPSNPTAAMLEPSSSPVAFVSPSSDPELRRLAKESDFATWLARKRQLQQR